MSEPSATTTDIPAGADRSVMIVVSQGDDAATHLGGTIRLWSEAGWRVLCVRVTDDASDAHGLSADAAGSANLKEFRQAAAILGITETINLNYPAGTLGDLPETELRGALVGEIRRNRPYALATYDPAGAQAGGDMDRYSVARAADQAFGASQSDLMHPEHLHPIADGVDVHGCFQRWYFGPGLSDATDHVDITSVIEHKLTAALSHRTKLNGFVHQMALQARTGGYRLSIIDQIEAGGSVKPLIETLLKAHGATVGKRCGAEFAEEFKVVTFSGLGALLEWFGRPLDDQAS